MLRPSRRINTAMLHMGAMFSTLLDLQTAIDTQFQLCHVYLELSTKRACKGRIF